MIVPEGFLDRHISQNVSPVHKCLSLPYLHANSAASTWLKSRFTDCVDFDTAPSVVFGGHVEQTARNVRPERDRFVDENTTNQIWRTILLRQMHRQTEMEGKTTYELSREDRRGRKGSI